MQTAIGGFADRDAPSGKGIAGDGDSIQIAVGSEGKPLISCSDEWAAGADREGHRDLLPGVAASERDPRYHILERSEYPGGYQVIRMDRVSRHERLIGVIKRKGSRQAEPVVAAAHRVGLRELDQWAELGKLAEIGRASCRERV